MSNQGLAHPNPESEEAFAAFVEERVDEAYVRAMLANRGLGWVYVPADQPDPHGRFGLTIQDDNE